jgi:hypothetical protein
MHHVDVRIDMWIYNFRSITLSDLSHQLSISTCKLHRSFIGQNHGCWPKWPEDLFFKRKKIKDNYKLYDASILHHTFQLWCRLHPVTKVHSSARKKREVWYILLKYKWIIHLS